MSASVVLAVRRFFAFCRTVWLPPSLAVLLLVILGTAAQAQVASVRISEILVDPVGDNDSQAIELFNTGPAPVSLNGAVIASGEESRTLRGLADVPPGGTVVIRWNQTGSSSGNQFFTDEVFELDPAEGNLALFKSEQVGRASEMVAYVQWGAPDQARADLAAQARLWDPAAFLAAVEEGRSMALLPGGSGRSPAEWHAAAPTIGAPNPAAARGFRGWALVGGHSAQAPSVVFVPDGKVVELASVAPGGAVRHYRLISDLWSRAADLGGVFAQAPALTAGAGGVLELAGVGAEQQVLHNRFLGGQWGSFVPVGEQRALSAALAFNTTANTAELVIVGRDNQLLHSRFNNGQWSPLAPVGGQSSSSPALVFNPQGSLLDLLFSGMDGILFHTRLAGSAWSAPAGTGGQTRLSPELVALPDGTLEAAITGTDGRVLQNRFQNGTWRGWQPIAGLQSDLPPTLVFSPESQSTELFVVGLDRQVRQVRRIGESWGAPAAIGAVAAFPVAAAAGADGLMEVMITGQDGQLWHNRFQVKTEPETSFASEIQPILTRNCSCHQSSSAPHGLDMRRGEAYGNLVDVPSAESDLDRVEPGDPEKSYLWHKIRGTHRSIGGSGGRMPLGRAPLPEAEIAKICKWIEQGARDN